MPQKDEPIGKLNLSSYPSPGSGLQASLREKQSNTAQQRARADTARCRFSPWSAKSFPRQSCHNPSISKDIDLLQHILIYHFAKKIHIALPAKIAL